MRISKGMYETLTSERISLEDKIECVERFSWPIHHLDGEHAGFIEPGQITKEDADLLIEALRTGNFKVLKSIPAPPTPLEERI